MEDILYYIAWLLYSPVMGIKALLELAEKYVVVRCLLIVWVIGLILCIIKEIYSMRYLSYTYDARKKESMERRDGINMGGKVKYRTILKRPLYRYPAFSDEEMLDDKLRNRMYYCWQQEEACEEGNKIVHEKSLISALTGSLYKGEDNGKDYLSYSLPVYEPYNILYKEKDTEKWRKRLGNEEYNFIRPYRENPFLYARYGSVATAIGMKSCAIYLKDVKGLTDNEYIYYHLYATCMDYKKVGDKYYLYVRDPYVMLQLDITDIATDYVKENIRSYAYDTDKSSFTYDKLHYKPIALEVKGTYDDIMNDKVLKATWIKTIGYKEATEILTLKQEEVESYDFDYEMKYYKDFSSNVQLCCGQIECQEEMHRYRDDIVRYIVQKNGLQNEM